MESDSFDINPEFICTMSSSSAILVLALLIADISPSDGFINSSCRLLPSKSQLPSLPLINQCRSIGCRHLSSNQYSRLQLRASEEPGDSSDKDDSNNDNLKSDEELFRDALDDRMYTQEEISSMAEKIFDEDDEEENDEYMQKARSEFVEEEPRTIVASSLESALARASRTLDETDVDWGGALETLSKRKEDIESGKSDNPAYAIFRTIVRDRPNESIGKFVKEANPEIVASMSGAVSSLLGSLSNPAMGIETVVQASSEKLGQLCFQLMMTGYMFRNAEYVIALKNLMNIKADATLQEYEAAFKKLDKDGNGYLEWDEVEAMLAEVYDGKAPAFEVSTFMEFFDKNGDGRISWEEFEKGFGGMKKNVPSNEYDPDAVWGNLGKALPASEEKVDDDDEEDEELNIGEPTVSGQIKVQLDDGRVIEVDAQEFIDDLKQQALELKRELAIEMGEGKSSAKDPNSNPLLGAQPANPSGSIARYIASLQGNIQPLTKGISPEVMEAMKMLIDYVVEGPASDRGATTRGDDGKPVEMELPGSALQQLALWQLVNGYRLRETEATGDWRRMME